MKGCTLEEMLDIVSGIKDRKGGMGMDECTQNLLSFALHTFTDEIKPFNELRYDEVGLMKDFYGTSTRMAIQQAILGNGETPGEKFFTQRPKTLDFHTDKCVRLYVDSESSISGNTSDTIVWLINTLCGYGPVVFKPGEPKPNLYQLLVLSILYHEIGHAVKALNDWAEYRRKNLGIMDRIKSNMPELLEPIKAFYQPFTDEKDVDEDLIFTSFIARGVRIYD
jgi:hypothetical protein